MMNTNFAEASESIVSNCDVGPACGMMDLVYIAAIVVGLSYLYVRLFPPAEWWNAD